MRLAITAGVVLAPPPESGVEVCGELAEATVVIEDGKISNVGRGIRIPRTARRIDALDQILTPGFIDMHVHGAGGHDLMEGSPEALATASRTLARKGTTSFFATTVTAGVPHTLEALERLGDWIGCAPSSLAPDGAQPLAIHMEGPFISHKRLGVHPPQHVLPPTAAQFQEFYQAAGGHLRILTMAPEVPGALEVMDAAAAQGVRVAMGHTDATFAEAQRAIGLGVRHAIHTFNAMRPFSHRDPGVIAATLLDERVAAELIADGVHVDTAAMRLLLKAKGPEGVLLITDGVAPSGMPEGRYRLGQLDVETRDGAVRSLDGILAGSILTLDRALRNLRDCTALPVRDLVRMVTWNQAKLMGITAQKGVIAPGADADLVLLDRELNVRQVFVRGKELT